jgi:hypothetical protein
MASMTVSFSPVLVLAFWAYSVTVRSDETVLLYQCRALTKALAIRAKVRAMQIAGKCITVFVWS